MKKRGMILGAALLLIAGGIGGYLWQMIGQNENTFRLRPRLVRPEALAAAHKQVFSKKDTLIETEEPAAHETKQAETPDTKREESVRLSIPQSVQETGYYCGPAVVQMILRYHGIEKSQEDLAAELRTHPITGSEYADMANVLNRYLFSETDMANGAGYHVQRLGINDTDPTIMETFERRVRQNVVNQDPTLVAIETTVLYPDIPSGNHVVICSGYRLKPGTDTIEAYYLIDPSYLVQDEKQQGLKTVTPQVLLQAMVQNDEPAYIW